MPRLISTRTMQTATVIGAGPAGCIASMMRSRAGWRVRLVEQHRFPRDKVCGECLSSLGFQVLARLGLTESFQQFSAVPMTRALIHSSNGSSIEMALPHPMWGISRIRFDQWLLNN